PARCRWRGDVLPMILDELSDCAPAPAGSGTLQTRPFDLVELAEAVLARPVPAAAARLSVFVDPELRTGALGDPGRLGRVLDRLAGAMLAESRPAPLRLEVLPVPAPAAAGATRRIRFLFLAEGGAAPARPDPDCREDAALMGGEIG